MNEQIREMESGRELDALVAEKVMGWRYHDGRGTAGPSYWETKGENIKIKGRINKKKLIIH